MTKQSMNNLLYNNIWWFVFYIILLSLEIALQIQKMVNVLCGVIWFAALLNFVLIYFQLWRPFKADEVKREEEDLEAGGDGLEEEWSIFACVPISVLALTFVSALFWFFNQLG